MKNLVWIVLAAFFLASCAATKEEMSAYYNQLDKQTQAIIESIEQQGKSNRLHQTQQMVHFSTSMTNAAKTPSLTDDVVVSFAWGYQSAQEHKIEIPNLPTVRAPETVSEQVRAWTPVIGMALPFLYPLFGGFGDSGTTYNVSDQGRVNVQSKNAGSYNKAGGDQSVTSTPTYQDENCQDCEGGGSSGGGEGETPNPGEFTDLETCEANPPFTLGDGTPAAAPGCSCHSRYVGGKC